METLSPSAHEILPVKHALLGRITASVIRVKSEHCRCIATPKKFACWTWSDALKWSNGFHARDCIACCPPEAKVDSWRFLFSRRTSNSMPMAARVRHTCSHFQHYALSTYLFVRLLAGLYWLMAENAILLPTVPGHPDGHRTRCKLTFECHVKCVRVPVSFLQNASNARVVLN